MHYDPSKIKEEFVEIDGKKIPIYKIPAGMSGPNAYKFYENVSIEESPQEEDEEVNLSSKTVAIFDEDNVYIDSPSNFLDL